MEISRIAKLFVIVACLFFVSACNQNNSNNTSLTTGNTTLLGVSLNPVDKNKTIENNKFAITLLDFRKSAPTGIAVIEVTNKQNTVDYFSAGFYLKLTSDEKTYEAGKTETLSLDSQYVYAQGTNFQKLPLAPSAKMTGEVGYLLSEEPAKLFLVVVDLLDTEVGRFQIK